MKYSAYELRDASLSFGSFEALCRINLKIESGERVAFIGPSGAGKTSTLRLLCAALFPDSGSVICNGRDLAQLSPGEIRRIRSHIGFVHQDLNLVPNLRVLTNVLLGRLGNTSLFASLCFFFRPKRTDIEEVFSLLKRVGIPEKLFERTDKLSGGQQQRVAIARALYQNPHTLLADEPVSSVDPARADDTVNLIVELSRELGFTLIVSLHNVNLAKRYFDRLIGLRRGMLVFDKPAAEVSAEEIERLYALEEISRES